MKRNSIFFLLLFIFSVLNAEAGDSLKVFRRTGIYGMFGGGEYIHGNINAEHFFVNSKIFHIGVRGAYGNWSSWGQAGNEAILTLSGLAGKKHHFAEFQAGSLLLIDKSEKAKDSNDQKPTNDYYFMMGIGYNLRWRHLLLKTGLELAPQYSILTFNAGMGIIF